MELPLRATAVFFFLWAVTRALGKRELAQMSAFELVLLITLGDLVQQGVTQEDYSVTGAFLAVGTIAFWVLVFGYVGFRFPASRNVIEGVPLVIVHKGKPMEQAMRTERLTLDEVLEAAREQGIRDLDEVEAAILDPDGTFAFIKVDGEQHQPDEKQAT
ncbi:MAG TPA: YetF domain-containing protein [Acidimicrobiales bacterium]|nr:YetF domain-containing protein [Acidimicrobiales bacterium]